MYDCLEDFFFVRYLTGSPRQEKKLKLGTCAQGIWRANHVCVD
jgi:hypothetical protein